MNIAVTKNNYFDMKCPCCDTRLNVYDYDWNYRNAEICGCPECKKPIEVYGVYIKQYNIKAITKPTNTA